MKPGTNEPENYSIDDMMERLKKSPTSKGEEAGELVVREDGSQVRRVRKRKRRSQQPLREREKMEQKRKFARLLASLALLVLITGVFAGCIIYGNSSSFRENLLRKIKASTGAEAELQQFRMNPTGANANTIQLTWPDAFPLANIQARGLRADTSIASFFGRSFGGQELNVSEGTATWRPPGPSNATRELEVGNVDFHRISISRFHLMPDESIRHMIRLRNAEASYYPNVDTGGRAQLRINGGQIQVRGLPDLNLDRAFMEFRGDEIHISGAKMFHGSDRLGEMLFAGSIPALDPAATATLTINASSFIMEGVVGEQMGRLILGRIDGSRVDGASTLRFPVSNPSAGVLELEFKSALNSPIQIKGFNFLSELAILLEEPWFEQPYFENDVTGTIRRTHNSIEISNFNAEYRNRLALRGTLRLDANGRLSGNIEVGLSPALVATAPTRRLEPIISESSGGYRWISIDIGGNINAPTDNFMSLIDNPPARRSIEGSGSSVTPFEDLTRPR